MIPIFLRDRPLSANRHRFLMKIVKILYITFSVKLGRFPLQDS